MANVFIKEMLRLFIWLNKTSVCWSEADALCWQDFDAKNFH